jgi:osmoprotectant transport system ATP-binding protein
MPILSHPSEAPARNVVIEFRAAAFRLGAARSLLAPLDLSVCQGETLVLLGRSGAGKTTTLKLINRLLEPSGGEVLVEGKSTSAWDPIRLRRHVGYAIQDVGLFPHINVERNIGLVPEVEGWTRTRIQARVRELLILVGLTQEYAERFPRELSGGERQRVGVARALALNPPILLMDEPFGALDPLTRAELQREFAALERRLGKTVVLVTHDLHEALLLGSKIALLDAGNLRGVYSPQEFLRSAEPLAAAYVAAFRAGNGSGEGLDRAAARRVSGDLGGSG